MLSAIEPQLHTQQSEISKLAHMVHKRPAERGFERRMSRFLGRGRKTSNLNMVDYRLTNDIKHGEQGQSPRP